MRVKYFYESLRHVKKIYAFVRHERESRIDMKFDSRGFSHEHHLARFHELAGLQPVEVYAARDGIAGAVRDDPGIARSRYRPRADTNPILLPGCMLGYQSTEHDEHEQNKPY